MNTSLKSQAKHSNLFELQLSEDYNQLSHTAIYEKNAKSFENRVHESFTSFD
jgi:hypothetical protein